MTIAIDHESLALNKSDRLSIGIRDRFYYSEIIQSKIRFKHQLGQNPLHQLRQFHFDRR